VDYVVFYTEAFTQIRRETERVRIILFGDTLHVSGQLSQIVSLRLSWPRFSQVNDGTAQIKVTFLAIHNYTTSPVHTA